MKEKIILTGKHGRPSTKNVFQKMQSTDSSLIQRRQIPKNGITYYRLYTPDMREDIVIDRKARDYKKINQVTGVNKILLRWGTREPLETDGTSIVYNKATAIKNATNKALSREIFLGNNVPIPRFVTPNNIDTINLPVIARPFVHSKGKNLYVLNSPEEFLNHYNTDKYYYSEFIDKEREFRVHVGHSKVIVLMEKLKPEDDNQIAWNRAQAGTEPFENIRWNQADEENLKPIMVAGIEAVNALELDCGAADVMLKDGKAYVLEVNTAPTLNSCNYTASRWAMYLDWLFRKDKRRAHWDYTEFKKASSLFWKNYQLNDEKK